MIDFKNKIKSKFGKVFLHEQKLTRSGIQVLWIEHQANEEVLSFLKTQEDTPLRALIDISVAQVEKDLIFTYFLGKTSVSPCLGIRTSVEVRSTEEWIECNSVAGIWPQAQLREKLISESFGVQFCFKEKLPENCFGKILSENLKGQFLMRKPV